MTRPTKVRIGGYKWSIEWLDSAKKWRKGGHSEDSSGETRADLLTVFVLLTKNLHPICEREVFLHELLHACAASYGQTYAIQHVKKADAEEVLIQGLSPALLAVLRNNPKVLAYLLDG